MRISSIFAAALCIGAVSTTQPTQSREPLGISIQSIQPIQSASGKSFGIKYSFTNSGSVSVFLPVEEPTWQPNLWSLCVQRRRADHWTNLPAHILELRDTDNEPLEIHPGGTYEGELRLDNPYYVSQWLAYPKPAYSIPLDGKLRLTIYYFATEEEWKAFDRWRKAESNTQWIRYLEKAHSASVEFQLPKD